MRGNEDQWLLLSFARVSIIKIEIKIKIVGPARQPGDFLSKAKESNQRRLCAALGMLCA